MRAGLIAAMGVALGGMVSAAVPARAANAVNGVTGTLFIADKREAGRRDGSFLLRIDLATGKEVMRVRTCENPHELAPSPDRKYIAVACFSETFIEIYSTDTLAKVKTIDLGTGARPHCVMWRNPRRLVSTAQGRGTIFTIDDPLSPSPHLREIGQPLKDAPHMIVVSRDGSRAWGADNAGSKVVAYDLDKGVETGRVQLSGYTEGIQLAADEKALFVAAELTGTLLRIDPVTLKVVASIPVGHVPVRVATDPDSRYAATTNRDDGTITLIDAAANKVIRTIPIAGKNAFLHGLTFSPDGKRLYADEIEGNAAVEVAVPSGKVLRHFDAGAGPDGFAVTR